MEALALDRAEVRIGGRAILGPLSFSIDRGECWAALGPNGSGKTTLLALAGARRQPSSGEVRVLGKRLGATPVRELWPRIGHVTHSLAERLGPSLTVEDVVLTGRSSTLVTYLQDFAEVDRKEAAELIDQAGCGQLADRRFGDCSMGERQRVLIARARFGHPEMLLLDEPAAGLDIPGREALVAATERACGDGATVLMATHHLEEIPAAATHALLLRGGEAVAAGIIDGVLRSAPLRDCFGVPVEASRNGSRWSATLPEA